MYRKARVFAARHDTSVSAMVGAYLRNLESGEDRFDRLLREEIELRRRLPDFRARERLSREELHRRRE